MTLACPSYSHVPPNDDMFKQFALDMLLVGFGKLLACFNKLLTFK